MRSRQQLKDASSAIAHPAPAAITKLIRRLEISSERLVRSILAGEYQSVFKGRGMSFEEVREYQEGDDPRNIDWNVTAR
ncbi:MAG: DUF58 domain-containing protein, partial [Cyanobacteria bacterium NC_groundwater_1444_Ag_S-0.65um_54_12]|nr:DUF58 domain-containing protein [Cyanobacteria bacterium NC_groundwater_1444_Ag_S-0.65um_54_12]